MVADYSTFDPLWTEIEFTAGGARDDLGIETLSEAILADLLPGINNQTRRARYYSFWAWIVRDFILDANARHTQAGLYEWLRKREDALILAYLAHGCGGGAAGTEQGSQVWAGGEPASFPLDWKSLVSVDGGGYELYYRGALLETHIIRRDEGNLHDDLVKPIGTGLADAYGEAVAGTTYARQYLDAGRLRRTDIEEFARYGCLCQLRHHEVERQRLVDALFRFDVPDADAVKRLASLCFFLDVIAQSQDRPLDEGAFRRVLYYWSYEDHHAYVPVGNLLSPAQRWRIFQLRQYFVFAVESFWSLFLNHIQSEPLSGEEYLAWLLDEWNLDALDAEFHLGLPTTDARKLSIQTLFQAVRDVLPSEALLPGPGALRAQLNERDLNAPIWRSQTAGNAQVRAGRALLTLAVLYWRCLPWQELPGWLYASERYATGRLPLAGYLRHVQMAFEEGWTVAQWLGWFHHSYLWLQHRRVTLEKLVSRKQETAKFELVEEAQTEPTGNLQPFVRYRGSGTDYPKMNAPRFPSALAILTDLALIEPLTSGGGYRLKPEGAALLERFRSYSIPEWAEPADEAAERPETTAG
jgi:hypothetical protein